jgi:hypothetical protein
LEKRFLVQFRPLPGQDGRIAEADGVGEKIGGRLAGGGGFQFPPVGGQFGGLGEEVLVRQPFLEAALPGCLRNRFACGVSHGRLSNN